MEAAEKKQRGQRDRNSRGRGKRRQKREPQEFDQQILDLARVTRVTQGGKQLSFRVCIIIGDRKGRVGYGVAKGKDVQIAVNKAVAQAKKNIIRIPFIHDTIPHAVMAKFKAGKVLIKPAPRGSGIIAGGATRTILELAGVPNASAKMLGKTTNKITNVKATFDALNGFLGKALSAAQKAKGKKDDMKKTVTESKADDTSEKPKVAKKATTAKKDSKDSSKK